MTDHLLTAECTSEDAKLLSRSWGRVLRLGATWVRVSESPAAHAGTTGPETCHARVEVLDREPWSYTPADTDCKGTVARLFGPHLAAPGKPD